jgi:small subunit ribosomal protein S2
VVTSAEVPSEVLIQDLLDAGLHFGHQTKRWNPKMKPFVFDKRNGIHIIDLAKTLVQLQKARQFVYDISSRGRALLFVGTKKQAQETVKEAATGCAQPYVETRWLGGTLTNAQTIRRRVKRLRLLDQMEKDGTFNSMPKKEVARLRHELEKLRKNLTGIASMEELPGAMFVVDVNREAIAIAEANRLHIPVIAIVDTNCNPDPVDYPIPGNDDAIRGIKLIASVIAATVSKGTAEYSKVAVEEARKRESEKAQAAAVRAAVSEQDRKTRAEAAAHKSRADEAGRATRKRTVRPASEAAPAPAPQETPAEKATPAADGATSAAPAAE